MTDRELLELAAKAISLPECGWMGPAFMYVKNNRFTDWNPLADDGDSLRLAVKLVLLNDEDFAAELKAIWMYSCTDYYAATRRAIVCAAAEIGRAKT